MHFIIVFFVLTLSDFYGDGAALPWQSAGQSL